MQHYIYCVENLVNGKIYVGKHSTDNLDDGYMGSGVALDRAVKKHGLGNFRKHILMMCESSEEAFELERQIVDEHFVQNDQTYNLVVGGKGGGIFTPESRAKGLQARWSDPEFRRRHGEKFSALLKERHAIGAWPVPDWTGRRHTETTKAKIGDTNSKHQTGSGNSQFNTAWIKHPDTGEVKKIKQDLLDDHFKTGWIRGRK